MRLVNQIISAIRERHVHLVAPTLFLINGMYLSVTGGIEAGNFHVADYIVMGFFLLAIPYLVIYGFLMPWYELRLTVGLGFLFWTTVAVIAGMVAVGLGLPPEPELLFSNIPGGMFIYAVFVGVSGSTMILTLPFSLRYGYMKITGSGGDGDGRSTPEEKVLSDEELEEFDHPTKKLRKILTALVSPNTVPNRI